MTGKWAGLSILAVGLLALPQAQAEQISKGQIMANNCLSCHGSKGQGPGEMPSIQDYTEQGLINSMTSYRDDPDSDATVMNRHAAAYSDAEIRAIASHIADLN
ncbi:c-type cytochrome [Thiohalorhabdus sp.]|uniref:c-type cytochrome n=1 Tax=Thiohalorhabdus sp. TaxID=3094134 RepID=UPI002FC2DF1E